MSINSVEYNIWEEPLVISKPLMDLLLSQEHPDKLLALYLFYYYTAKWQKTNIVRATDSYVAEGLKWTRRTVIKFKKRLVELGLISQVVRRDKQGKVRAYYIKVNFIWTREKVRELEEVIQCEKNAHWTKPAELKEVSQCEKKQTLDKFHTNALSINNINALSNNNRERENMGGNGGIDEETLNTYIQIMFKEGKVKNIEAYRVSTRRALRNGDLKPEDILNKIRQHQQKQEVEVFLKKLHRAEQFCYSKPEVEDVWQESTKAVKKKYIDTVREEARRLKEILTPEQRDRIKRSLIFYAMFLRWEAEHGKAQVHNS